MSAGSLAKVTPASVIEIEPPEEVTPQLMASFSIRRAGWSGTTRTPT